MKIAKNIINIFLIFIMSITIYFTLCSNVYAANKITKIPEPPAGGPSMQGNFNVVGNNIPDQIYDKYKNVQIITDGSKDSKQAMWWKNKVNVTKPFTIKFYAFITAQDLSNVADGITFTLQNDKYSAIGTNGESLGVYGNVRSSNYYGGEYIKNALSYEFDPYNNGDYSDKGLKDKYGNTINGQHTAFTTTANYGHTALDSYFDNGFIQNHYDAHSLNDWPGIFYPKWHKFIYNWKPSFNNKQATASVNIDGSNIVQSYTIDIQKVLQANRNNPFVWWGFTGSTGLYTMTSAIADTAVSGDPGITKLVLNLSKLKNDDKKNIKNSIQNSNQSKETKQELNNCIDNPSASSYNEDLSNILVSIIDQKYFQSTIKNADLGDVLLYKIDIYNYKTADGLGNSWYNVKVSDDNLSDKGMTTLDNKDNINATYSEIPPIDINSDSDSKPSSVGLRTIISSPNGGKMTSKRDNIVTANGSNFYGDNIQGSNSNKSSTASVYVNNTTPPIKPRIFVDNHIYNLSKNKSNNVEESNTLSNVSNYDLIKYSVSLSNIIKTSKTSNNAQYQFKVPSIKGNPEIILGSTKLSTQKTAQKPYYTINNDNSGSSKIIKIYNITSISGGNNINLNVNLKLGNHNPESFSSTPTFKESNNFYYGKQENFNFENGSLEFNYINNINFGYKNSYLIGGLLSPYSISNNADNKEHFVNNNNYTIAQINDSRRDNSPFSVYLTQIPLEKRSTSSVNEIGVDDSPFIIKYVDGKNLYPINIKSMPIKIYEYNNDNDSDTHDIVWNNKKEIKLGNNNRFNINNYKSKNKTEKYKANLNWIIKDNDTP